MRTIYLDYNATTPVPPSVREAMAPFFSEDYGNPSSTHPLGRAAHEAVKDARTRVAHLLGAQANEIVFTSGGTESNNLAIIGVCWQPMRLTGGRLVISALEHPSVAEPAQFLRRLGYEVRVVRCNRQGRVDPADVVQQIDGDTRLVSILHANNEIGTLQPLREIAEACHARGVPVHTDAAQSIGKLPVRVDELGVDLLSLAGHKLYGPKGVGALYVRRGIALEPLLHGAGQEAGQRPGTENVPAIVGLGAAAELAERHFGEEQQRQAELRDRLEARLRSAVSGLVVHGASAARLPNTTAASFPGVSGAALLQAAPELCASTGAACHAEAGAMSATLAAIGCSAETARGTVRLSLGRFTTERDVDRAADLLAEAWLRLEGGSP